MKVGSKKKSFEVDTGWGTLYIEENRMTLCSVLGEPPVFVEQRDHRVIVTRGTMKRGGTEERIQYGYVEGEPGLFWFWYIGGENFDELPGDFRGPFSSLAEARRAAEAEGKKRGLKVSRV